MYPPPGVRNGDRPARAAADTGDSCSSGVPDFDLRTDFAVVIRIGTTDRYFFIIMKVKLMRTVR